MKKLRKFWNHIKPWWKSEEKVLAWSGFLSIIALSLTSVYMGVVFNSWMKDFYNALEQKNLAEFSKQILIFMPIVSLLILNFVALSYLSSWFIFRWRKWMTSQMQNKWLHNKNYYKLMFSHEKVDNPDQRIAKDIWGITALSISLFKSFFKDGVNCITFSIILWNVSSKLQFNLFGNTIYIPGLLVWVAWAYSLIGVIIVFKVGRPLVDLDRMQEKCEANFRFSLMRIFERKEEVATLSGENFENNKLNIAFNDITNNFYEILRRKIYINLFQKFHANASMFIPLMIVSPLYFKEIITMGVLMQIQGMFGQVSGSISVVVGQFSQIASLIASFQRFVDFNHKIDLVEQQKSDIKNTDSLSIKNLHVNVGTNWNAPDIDLLSGDRKLLIAPSGTGKTSLLRIMAGLSSAYKEDKKMVLNVPKDMMFIPQKPYMPHNSTLRECLTYPSLNWDEKSLIKLMKACMLEHLIPRLDEIQDYQQTLSVGEQQRINFLRALLHKPKWLMMDEPASNLNHDYTEVLCKLLSAQLKDSGILVISHTELPYFEKIIKVK